MRLWLASLLLVPCLAGCGSGSPHCDGALDYSVYPSNATADHSATAPGNQEQFSASVGEAPEPGCAVPALSQLLHPSWTVSDPAHVKISSAADSTNGLATCLGATAGAVVVTANIDTGTNPKPNTASLTCK